MLKQVETDSAVWNLFDQGDGEPILFVHGFPLDHSMWQFQLEHFSREFRVLAPDLPGFGKSQLKEIDEPASMEQYANQLAELLGALKIDQPIHFCGLSMGGYIGWEFWRNYPERLMGLVACDTRAAGDSPETVRGREFSALAIERDGAQAIANGLIPKLFAPLNLEQQATIVEETRSVICASERTAVAAAQRAMAKRLDASGWLKSMEIPALVVVGEHDSISTSEEMRTISEAIPDSTFVEIEGAGHMAPLEAPDRFNSALGEWLNDVRKKRNSES